VEQESRGLTYVHLLMLRNESCTSRYDFPPYMVIEDAVSYSQNPSSDLYLKANKSSPHPTLYILNTNFYLFSCVSQVYRRIYRISFLF
jgi:hypothetical protein